MRYETLALATLVNIGWVKKPNIPCLKVTSRLLLLLQSSSYRWVSCQISSRRDRQTAVVILAYSVSRRSLHVRLSLSTSIDVKQVYEVIWQEVASCHPWRRRMGSSDLDRYLIQWIHTLSRLSNGIGSFSRFCTAHQHTDHATCDICSMDRMLCNMWNNSGLSLHYLPFVSSVSGRDFKFGR